MKRLLTVALAALAVVGCLNRPSTPDTSFAPYVTAYTGGSVSPSGPISIRLASDVAPEKQITEGLFSFSPSVKGTVVWNGPSSVDFIPDEPFLEEGKVYNATFALPKVLSGAPGKFPFSFIVRKSIVAEEVDTSVDDNGFRIKGIKKDFGGNPHIDVVFSENLSNQASLKGLIELEGVGRQYVDVKGNIASVYFESPEEKITLKVSSALKSAAGNALGKDCEEVFLCAEEKPQAKIALSGNILPDRGQLILPLKAVNLAAVDVSVIRIFESNVLMFLQDNDLKGDDDLRRSGRLILRQTFRLDSDPSVDLHTWNDFPIDLTNLFKKEQGAIYRIRVTFRKEYSLYGKADDPLRYTDNGEVSLTDEDRVVWDTPQSYWWESYYDWDEYEWDEKEDPDKASYYMDEDKFPVVNLMTSEIGLLAKYSDGKELWVSATKISSAKAASGAKIEVYDYQLQKIASGKTDSKGDAVLKVDRRPFVVTATSGGSTTYLKVTDGRENSYSRFDTGGETLTGGIRSFIYGERGVWRPGDTLHVTMLVSDPERLIPSGHPATMELYTPEGRFHSKKMASAENGFYVFHIPTSASDPTGFYNAYFHLGSSTFHKRLNIETVKPNRLKIHFDTGTKMLHSGAVTDLKFTANWLTGPAAAGLKAKTIMTLSAGSAPFKGFDGYTFNNPASNFSSESYIAIEGILPSSGELTSSVIMPDASDAPGMLTASMVSSVMETGGDESFTTSSMPFSPFSAYVGLKFPDGDYLETDSDQSVSVAVVNPDGKRVGGHELEYRVFKLKWSWWWESRRGELDSYVNGSGADAITSGKLVSSATGDAKFTIRVDYPEWGRYFVFVKDKESGHVSGRVITIDWPAYRGRADRRDPTALTMLTFSLDKREYAVGETATVFIPASEGQALVSIENGSKVLARHHVSTSAGKDTPFKFKVTEDMAPNFYVNITLVQPYGSADNDLPLRMYGVQKVMVSNPASHLEPILKVADTIHPEEEFTISVSEASGKPMSYTLAIVDEGLLDITAFKTPDPWASMYAPVALGVKTWDMYDDVVGAFSGRFSPMFAIGGDQANVVAAKKDNRFNPVVKFLGPFSLEKGTANHKVTLPMYVGSVKVMLVAARDRAYGNAEKCVTVKSPLMVLSTLPRVVSDGEQVTMPVNVFSMEDGARDVKVAVKVDGPLKITGSPNASLHFSASGDKVVRFALAASGTGMATVTVNATSGSLHFDETINIEVRNPNPVTAKVTDSILAPGKEMTFAPEDGNGRLTLSTFPAVNVSGMFTKMKSYPYDCSEQLSSKGLVMLHLKGLLSEAEAAEADGIINQTIADLYSRQNSDGGFGYWKGSRSDTWVTSLVGQFLTEAAAKGFTVNGKVLSGWNAYQNRVCQAYKLVGGSVFSELDQAYRLYTLAVAGKAQVSAMNRLKEAQDLGYRASWMLAAAYAVSGKASVAKDMINALTNDFSDNESGNMTYGSSLRDRAIAVDALALTGVDARTLALAEAMANRINTGWYGTGEAAFAAVALDHLAAKVPSQAVSAEIAGKPVASTKSALTVDIPAKTVVKNTGAGNIYLSFTDIFQKKGREKVEAAANGLSISVSYANAKGASINPASIKQGEEFTSSVTVRNTGITYVGNLALSEMIPSGWEIVNERLRSGVESADNADLRDDRALWYFGLGAGSARTFKLKLRAAYEGDYVLPAIKCEAMYDPSISANTASASAAVVR
ncbi:MAG: alpha-2-macroglobulin [Bacteroidales bacterium]|nr:alpha-2-macroglobulin [Bacteroidales bacterium]